MEDNLNSNESTSEAVDTQQTEQTNESTNETVNAGNEDVTTSQVDDKQVQTPEENSKYASFRRDQEAKSQQRIDQHYNNLYGESNNVHSEAEYNQAIAAQEATEAAESQRQQYEAAGVNPDIINQLINDNPNVRQANEIIAQQKETARINSEVNDLFVAFPDAKDAKIPDSVFIESINNGISLKYAYSMYVNQNASTIAEQKTLRGLQQNAAASPGSLNGDQAEKSDFSKMSSKDFNDLTARVLRGEKINL